MLREIVNLWPVIVFFLAAIAYVYKKLIFDIPAVEKRLAKLERENKEMADVLALKVDLTSCRINHQDLCHKIDALEQAADSRWQIMEDKRNKARESLLAELQKISYFMGRVEQFMEERKKNGARLQKSKDI